MEEKVILLLCYTEGVTNDGPNGISFRGPPSKGITFQEGKGFDELKKRLNDEFDTLGGLGELEITYRCPASNVSKSTRFVPLLLRNDNDVKFMTTIATHLQVPSCVELYIKRSQTFASQIPTTSLKRKLDASELLSFRNRQNAYEEFPRWMNMLVHTNKGTQVQWDLISRGTSGYYKFKRVFWSFGAVIEGFAYCRPFIQVDGIPLSNYYHDGPLLFATSVDSNGCIYPLAFAIVEEESDDSWSWFLRILRTRVTQRDGICLISNMHKGILSVVNDPNSGWKEPKAHHRLCLQHMATSFDGTYKKKDLKDLMYRAGCQHQKHKYEKCMNELKQLNPRCLNFFTHVSTEKWTQSYDNGYRYGWLITNLAECMNDVLEGVSRLPIDAIVKLTFHRCVEIFCQRKVGICVALGRGESYTKYAMEKISKWKERASSHTVVTLDNMNETFEVVTGSHGSTSPKGQNKQTVRLKDKTCTCNKWQSFGIPCSHLIAVCLYCHMDYWKFVEDYYKLTVYKSCYTPSFNRFDPLPDKCCWPKMNFMIEHPKGYWMGECHKDTSRTRNAIDWVKVSTKTRCGLCKQEGHKRRFCPSQKKGASSCTNNKS